MIYIIGAAFMEEGFISSLTANMVRGLLPLIVLILIFWMLLRIANRKAAKDAQDVTTKMLNEDHLANSVRTKEIEQSRFFVPDLSKLPVRKFADGQEGSVTAQRQAKAVELGGKKMLHITGMSNVDLKKAFGAAQLDAIANYEENFSKYMHAMRFWAEALITAGKTAEAQQVLEASVTAGSELSQTYTLLADIYAQAGDFDSLTKLRDSLQKRTNMPGKGIAEKHINQLFKGA